MKGKYKVCLEYHLGNCKGPCEGYQGEDDYRRNLQYIRYILKGNTAEVIRDLKAQMQEWAVDMEFEKAEVIRQKIEALSGFQAKSTVVNPQLGNLDVATILTEDGHAFVNYMMVSNGSIIYARTMDVERKLDEEESDILSLAVARFREMYQSVATEVIAPFEIDVAEKELKVTVPKAGDKKSCSTLSIKNAEFFAKICRSATGL